jgi:hypothetical protein
MGLIAQDRSFIRTLDRALTFDWEHPDPFIGFGFTQPSDIRPPMCAIFDRRDPIADAKSWRFPGFTLPWYAMLFPLDPPEM